jgi:general stress protein 26
MSAEVQELSGSEGMKKIGGIIGDIRFAMMITAAPDGSFDSRPMATQKTEFDGVLWFLTGNDSRKVGELAESPQIALVFADPDNAKYVSLKGSASVSHDPQKIHELWNPMYQAWFPQGEQDPQIRVLRVDVTEGEFWEANESKIVRTVKYLAAAATKGSINMGEHGKVTV